MTQEKNIIIPRWFLEVVEDTLRIQYNIDESDRKETGESCQDRNIKECLNGVRKLLNGEELTGSERIESLYNKSLNIDKAIEWLNKNAEDYIWFDDTGSYGGCCGLTDNFEEDFRKAMLN